MSVFEPGDTIRINARNYPEWHGKKGIIQCPSKAGNGFVVNVTGNDDKEMLLDLLPFQMVKVVHDPAFAKLLCETLPELTKQVDDEYNADRETTMVEQANRDLVIYQSAMAEGYMKGFTEGYIQGYEEACAKVRQMFIKHGLIPPTPDDNKKT